MAADETSLQQEDCRQVFADLYSFARNTTRQIEKQGLRRRTLPYFPLDDAEAALVANDHFCTSTLRRRLQGDRERLTYSDAANVLSILASQLLFETPADYERPLEACYKLIEAMGEPFARR
jgi:hypothetical protein